MRESVCVWETKGRRERGRERKKVRGCDREK